MPLLFLFSFVDFFGSPWHPLLPRRAHGARGRGAGAGPGAASSLGSGCHLVVAQPGVLRCSRAVELSRDSLPAAPSPPSRVCQGRALCARTAALSLLQEPVQLCYPSIPTDSPEKGFWGFFLLYHKLACELIQPYFGNKARRRMCAMGFSIPQSRLCRRSS